MGAKQKWILVGVLVLLVPFALLSFRRIAAGGAADVVSDFELICVVSGERYSIARDDIRGFPARNPDTGERTLVPIMTDENGTLRVRSRYEGSVQRLADVNRYVDPENFEVLDEPRDE